MYYLIIGLPSCQDPGRSFFLSFDYIGLTTLGQCFVTTLRTDSDEKLSLVSIVCINRGQGVIGIPEPQKSFENFS